MPLVFSALFVTMLGYGIVIPALPFYVARLSTDKTLSPGSLGLHVALLTGAFALGQFVAAPFWGRWSDHAGRKPAILIGLLGFSASQLVSGGVAGLPLLYASRLGSGVFAGAVLPAVAAYVADALPARKRPYGMAWMAGSASLGVVAGPALSGLLSGRDWHFAFGARHFYFDGFSVPFLVSAALAGLTAMVIARWLPRVAGNRRGRSTLMAPSRDWPRLLRRLIGLLTLVVASQTALALFEATFAVHAIRSLDYGPQQIGYAFVVCGLVMAVFQVGGVSALSRRISPLGQIAWGFAASGTALSVLPAARHTAFVLPLIGVFALGIALIAPNLLLLISMRSRPDTGTGLGLQNMALSLGQIGGPLIGGTLAATFGRPPYTTTGLILLAIGLGLSLRSHGRPRPRRRSRSRRQRHQMATSNQDAGCSRQSARSSRRGA